MATEDVSGEGAWVTAANIASSPLTFNSYEVTPYHVIGVGGGSGGYNIGAGGGGGYSTTTANPIITLPAGSPCYDAGALIGPKGASKLDVAQLSQLMREHTFIPMAGSNFCLFCYALDLYRDAEEHIFVISEE